jgi:parallel beta-helix repeat protein
MKKLAVVGVVLLSLMNCFSAVAQTNERMNLPSSVGRWLFVGGTGPGNYTKIQDAINDSVDGDTVFVYSGHYLEKLLIRKSIRIVGEDRQTTVIALKNNLAFLVVIRADNVTFQNFTVVNEGGSQVTGIAVGGNQNLVEGVTVQYCDVGISLVSNSSIVRNNTIQCRFQAYSCGIGIWGNSDLVEDNEVFNCGDPWEGGGGIDISHSKGVKIQGNFIHDNSRGIYLSFSRNCRVENNTLKNNLIQALFFESHFTRWSGNYWNRPRVLPYIILGGFNRLNWEAPPIFWINVDWRPV